MHLLLIVLLSAVGDKRRICGRFTAIRLLTRLRSVDVVCSILTNEYVAKHLSHNFLRISAIFHNDNDSRVSGSYLRVECKILVRKQRLLHAEIIDD